MDGLGEMFAEAVGWALAAPRKSPQRWILLAAIVVGTIVVVSILALVSS